MTDSIPALELFRGDTAAIELSAHFSDPDGDTLTFGAETTDGGVATVSVLSARLSLTGVKQGTATVTVTAQDPAGLTASQTFRVTVPNRPPVVTDTVPALELFRGDTAAIELSAHFSDPDGDTLTFGAEDHRRGCRDRLRFEREALFDGCEARYGHSNRHRAGSRWPDRLTDLPRDRTEPPTGRDRYRSGLGVVQGRHCRDRPVGALQ